MRRCMSTSCWTWFHESGQQDQKLQSSYSQACDAVPISRFGFTNGITYSMRHFVSSGLVRVSWVMSLMGAISLPTLARRGACPSAPVPNCQRSPPLRRPAYTALVDRYTPLPVSRPRNGQALRYSRYYLFLLRRFCHPESQALRCVRYYLCPGPSKHHTQQCPSPREEAHVPILQEEAHVPTPGTGRP